MEAVNKGKRKTFRQGAILARFSLSVTLRITKRRTDVNARVRKSVKQAINENGY